MGLDDATYDRNLNALFGTSEAEISRADYSGKTPLHFASALGDMRAVTYLLTHGASVHVRDR